MKEYSKGRILIVDDENYIRDVCRKALEKENHIVAEAGTLKEAKEKIKKEKIDLVICDVKLPDGSGLEIFPHLKKAQPEAGIIFITGYAEIEDAISAIKCGAFDYIQKPFDMEKIKTTVKNFFTSCHLKKYLPKLRDISNFYQFAVLTTKTVSLNEYLEEIIKLCEKQIPTDGGSIGIFNEEEGNIKILKAWGKGKEKAEGKILKLGERPTGFVASTKEAITIDGAVNRHPLFQNTLPYENIKSGMSVPMLVEDSLVGVLNFKRITMKKPFNKDELNIAFVIAEIAASRIANINWLEKIKKLDKLKSAFVANVSHELRNPLTSIISASRLLKKEEKEETKKKLTEIIDRNSQRMKALIADILDAQEIERGEFRIFKEKISSLKLIDESTSFVAPKAEKKKMKIEIKAEDFEVFCDPRKMIQVLVNLLDNAIKYAPSGTKVTLAARKKKDRAFFSVLDEGKPIPKELYYKIFERFFKADNSLTRPSGSFGLGLSIVKEIVAAHNGTISIESKKGNCFIVEIPVK